MCHRFIIRRNYNSFKNVHPSFLRACGVFTHRIASRILYAWNTSIRTRTLVSKTKLSKILFGKYCQRRWTFWKYFDWKRRKRVTDEAKKFQNIKNQKNTNGFIECQFQYDVLRFTQIDSNLLFGTVLQIKRGWIFLLWHFGVDKLYLVFFSCTFFFAKKKDNKKWFLNKFALMLWFYANVSFTSELLI